MPLQSINISAADDVIVDTAGAALATGLSVSSMNKLRCFGGGPVFLKLGRSVRYRVGDLRAWLRDRERASTSASGTGVAA